MGQPNSTDTLGSHRHKRICTHSLLFNWLLSRKTEVRAGNQKEPFCVTKAQNLFWFPRPFSNTKQNSLLRQKTFIPPRALEKIHSFQERGRTRSHLVLLEGQGTLFCPETYTDTEICYPRVKEEFGCHEMMRRNAERATRLRPRCTGHV